MGSEVAAACCCDPSGDFFCVDYCSCLPSEMRMNITTTIELQERVNNAAILRSFVRLNITDVRLLRTQALCLMASTGGAAVQYENISYFASGAPNFEDYGAGAVAPVPHCGLLNCVSSCNGVYPCKTETLTGNWQTYDGAIQIRCYDPCRMLDIGTPNDCCVPQGFPYVTIDLLGPVQVNNHWHCPWQLRTDPGCPTCVPNLCCCEDENFEGFGNIQLAFWGKKGCIATDSFSSQHLFPDMLLPDGLPRATTCADNGVDPVVPIPLIQPPPNNSYLGYRCTPGSCACPPGPNQPTTIPNTPASYTTQTACVVCATPNSATDRHGCWTLIQPSPGIYQHIMNTYCNCEDPPAYDTPTGGSYINPVTAFPNWPLPNPGQNCEPISCPATNGCGCRYLWYQQTYNVQVTSITP